jgi:hypothetical protein
MAGAPHLRPSHERRWLTDNHGIGHIHHTSERELLSIVQTLKEFRTILLGHEIKIFTDHLNLIKPKTVSQSNRLMRWRLLIGELVPTFNCIPGPKNVVADALSRLPKVRTLGRPCGPEICLGCF